MRGNSSCRKHNIHSRQPPEQHETKTRKQHECKRLKHTEDTQKQTSLLKILIGIMKWQAVNGFF